MSSLQILLVNAINTFFYLLEILFLVRIFLSFFGMGPNSMIGNIVYRMTEPIIAPVRAMVDRSPLGGGVVLDFTYIFALILLSLVKGILTGIIMMF